MLPDLRLIHFLTLGNILISIGIFGILSRRNIITLLFASEILFSGVNVILAALAQFTHNVYGVALVFFVMAITACETIVILSLALILYKQSKSIDLETVENAPHNR